MENSIEYRYSIITIGVAAVLWYLMFVIKPMNFWVEMSLSIIILTAMALVIKKSIIKFERIKLRHVVIGILSAFALYLFFYIGNIISGYIFPFKDSQVLSVYSNKAGGNLAVIGGLLFFIIGPGEEIYWRGFIQKIFEEKFGSNKGYVLAAILYTSVHILTGNFMLIIAAFVCGMYWGWIYKVERSLVPVIISHAIWDATIFVLLPVM